MRLKTVGDGCRNVLGDLQDLVDEYQSLGIQSKRTYDRMKWGAEEVTEVRQRLISNTAILTAFISWVPSLPENEIEITDTDTSQYFPNWC